MRKPDGTSIPVTKEAAAGAVPYSNFVLSIYDIEVLMFEMRYVFKCPASKILEFYNENISGRHLEIGVGTGYFLDKCEFPVEDPMVHLLDLNLNSLQKTSNRIKRYHPVSHHWNALEPMQEVLPLFDSIGAGNFLHCLPGTMLSKEIVFKNLKPFLSGGGVFFGLTILGQEVDAGALYRMANYVFNKMSIFCNLNDNLADLEKILAENFEEYSLNVIGHIAFFTGHNRS